MKTWIYWTSRIVGGMLFQGGYVISPTMLVAGRPAQAADEARRETKTEESPCGAAVAAHACHGY